jgi:hypothetical protein
MNEHNTEFSIFEPVSFQNKYPHNKTIQNQKNRNIPSAEKKNANMIPPKPNLYAESITQSL